MAYQSADRAPGSITISEPSQIGEARRFATQRAENLGMDATSVGKVALVVNELASNLIKHGRGGEMVIRVLPANTADSDCDGIEILCIDAGPGIANVASAMKDGYSTSGTPGNGLGAVRRIGCEFDLYSNPGKGTIVLVRVPAAQNGSDRARSRNHLPFGVVSLPKAGETMCGDAWAVSEIKDGRSVVIVVDGLGHGVFAADAAQAAMRVFQQNLAQPSHVIIELIHAGLRSTRGAAVAVAEIQSDTGKLHFTGLGNISAACFDGTTMRSMVSMNGTAGVQLRRVQEFVYPWTAASQLFMHSDGLGNRWKLDSYPGLHARHPATIAAMLYRDHRRVADDATILVAGGGGRS